MRGNAGLDEVLGACQGVVAGAIELAVVHAAEAGARAGLIAAAGAVLADVRAALGLEVGGLIVDQLTRTGRASSINKNQCVGTRA